MMLTNEEFRKQAHQLVDWMADYMGKVDRFPVKSQVAPGVIKNQIPSQAPVKSNGMDEIFDDFKKIILPGITHWQSPKFHAYFPANSSYPSVLGEMLMAVLGVQGMIWDTSPAAAELEERVLQWLQNLCGLPDAWHGVIQDTASTATLVSVLTAREKLSGFQTNKKGLKDAPVYRVYCSIEAHSSVEKAVKIAGLGAENVMKIPVDEDMAMLSEDLAAAIDADMQAGYQPLAVVAALGTTGTVAMDPLGEIASICKNYSVWLHVDAAYAGSVFALEEYRYLLKGIADADSYVFNPHKWLFTNFDCTAYYVKDKDALIRTFEIMPEYLKTGSGSAVNNYRDWGIQLGRRFRALKLWFVLRNFGVEGIRATLRNHLKIAQWVEGKIEAHHAFELVQQRSLNALVFRYHPKGITDEEEINSANRQLLERLNQSGKIYLTHTKVRGMYVIRMIIGQTYVTQAHVEESWRIISKEVEN
mgnify:CR=1 FL=1